MKKLIILLLLPLWALSQNLTVPLPPGIVYEQRLNAKIDSLAKALTGTVKPPPVPLPACKRGPTIEGISKITSTSANVLFDGDSVIVIAYEVRRENGSRVVLDSIRPQWNTITVTYPALSNGSYFMRIAGKSCKSDTSQRKFTVKTDEGTAPPPVPTGDILIKEIASGLPQNMNIFWTVMPDGTKLFSDSSIVAPPNGNEFWYSINGHIIKQSVPLRNFQWPSNTPLGIWKAMPKKGLTTLAKWSDRPSDNPFFDVNASQAFPYNDSYPFANYLFEDKNKPGYDVTRQVVHWMDYMPDMRLPAGQVLILPRGNIDPARFLLNKGITHFSKFEIVNKPDADWLMAEGYGYDEVPQTAEQFGLQDRGPGSSRWVPNGVGWPNNWNERFFGPYREGQTEPLTYAQGYQAGLNYTTAYPIVIFENQEQDHAIAAHWSFRRAFYDAFMPRILARWPNALVADNYFSKLDAGALTLGNVNRQANKEILRTPIGLWPRTDLLLGGSLAKTNLVCFGYYLNAPDLDQGLEYKFMFSAKVAKLAGKEEVAFIQSFREDRPNNFVATYMKEGTFYMRTKMHHNPAATINYSFFAQCFGKGLIPFSAASKTDGKFAYNRQYHGENEGTLWLPKGEKDFASLDRFPYWTTGKEAFAGGQFEWGVMKGAHLYNDTFAQVKGGVEEFLSFKIDGVQIRAINKDYDDLVDAYYDKRGFVYSQRKGDKLAVFYVNSFADASLHDLEYTYQGKTYKMKVHSTIVHPVVHQL